VINANGTDQVAAISATGKYRRKGSEGGCNFRYRLRDAIGNSSVHAGGVSWRSWRNIAADRIDLDELGGAQAFDSCGVSRQELVVVMQVQDQVRRVIGICYKKKRDNLHLGISVHGWAT
jgi:hypothetical protein